MAELLVVNAGSSSLKLSVLGQGDRLLFSETVDAKDGHFDRRVLGDAIARSGKIGAVGHRIVHGGPDFAEPVVVDARVLRRLHEFADLAPLHQRVSLDALAAVSEILPGVPAVACFDTAFHAGMPPVASTYALPQQWRDRWGLRRYGFHGLSHSYAARRAAELMAGGGAAPVPLRVVTCHLGAGASLAAVLDGSCVDTTMGFTPLEGLVMATRSGTVGPGLLLWLQEHKGLSPSELSDALEHRSGLAGLAGTGDMRQVLEAEAAGDERAALALGVYLHRLRALIASMAAALGGLDALVFTGGVGEHSAEVRLRAGDGLGFLGVSLDPDANSVAEGDVELTGAGASARTFVVEAREDLEISRGVRSVLAFS